MSCKIGLFISLLLLFSCAKKREVEPSAPANCLLLSPLSYTNGIRKIINVNCNLPDCHSSEGDAALKLLTYPEAARAARNGTMKFRLSLPLSDPMHMPLDREMDACDLYKLKTWIEQGFPEN